MKRQKRIIKSKRELTLEEIHSATLNIMDYIHDLCAKNGIKYYLGYGTLLGAVRHQGFIPWDDDFDIQIPRKDFNKFCRIMLNEKNNHIKLVNRANTEGYTFAIPRVVDSRFYYQSTQKNSNKIKNPDMGIFIDVYPFDNYGNKEETARYLLNKIERINGMYAIYMNGFSLRGWSRSIIRMPLHFFLRIIYGRHYNSKVDSRIYKIIEKHTKDTDKYIGQVTWERGCNQFNKEWFAERVLVPFEDRQFWVPKGYDMILKKSYGNYMELPPQNQRVSTHDYKIYRRVENELI